jgi:hypothetical protein
MCRDFPETQTKVGTSELSLRDPLVNSLGDPGHLVSITNPCLFQEPRNSHQQSVNHRVWLCSWKPVVTDAEI